MVPQNSIFSTNTSPRETYDINEKSDFFPFRIKEGEYWTSIDATKLPYYEYPKRLGGDQLDSDPLYFNPVYEAALLEKRSHSGLFGLDRLCRVTRARIQWIIHSFVVFSTNGGIHWCCGPFH